MALRVIKRGAEAVLSRDTWMEMDVVRKHRVRKGYRHPRLDDGIRRARTRLEAKMLGEARALGVPTPVVYDVDLPGHTITMSFIEGRQMKDVLREAGEVEADRLCRSVGGLVATMHAGGLVHGDLTTSNMLVGSERVYLIDLSLGGKSMELEEQGVDLHLLKEAMTSTHADRPELFQSVLAGYLDGGGDSAVVDKIAEIEGRGRYT